jgi:hypothetical protein
MKIIERIFELLFAYVNYKYLLKGIFEQHKTELKIYYAEKLKALGGIKNP